MKIKSHQNKIALAFASCAVILFCVTAYALTNNLLAGGTIDSSELFNGPAAIRMVQIIMNPGDTIPWHYHPGRAYVIVKSGTIAEESGCGGTEEFSAGEAFEETTQSVHQVRNLGTAQAELYVTVLVPAGNLLTIPTGGPLCGPPTNVDQCQNDGWMSFNHPRSFSNQGDCMQYVLTRK